MDVKKVAALAHLEITEEEIAMYSPQLAGIVEYIEQLNELDTDDVEPMLGGLTDEGAATETQRGDVRTPSLGEAEALAEAPDPQSGHFRVPKVL
jgi:aspartyl-tRNA(Asn)/glutamyl-tRNA(Gln) amidotransferase subunit C